MHDALIESNPAVERRAFPTWTIVICCMWLGLIGGIELIRPEGNTTSLCLFRNVTGVPCPTCGSTRAVLALTRGDFVQAMMFNPLLIAMIVFGAIWLLIPRARKNDVRTRIATRPAIIWISLAIALSANWIYLLWREG